MGFAKKGFAMSTGTLQSLLVGFDPDLPLDRAKTIPNTWYTDPRVYEAERAAVFGGTWQVVGRVGQVREPGAYLTAAVAGEPVLVIRGEDGVLRADPVADRATRPTPAPRKRRRLRGALIRLMAFTPGHGVGHRSRRSSLFTASRSNASGSNSPRHSRNSSCCSWSGSRIASANSM